MGCDLAEVPSPVGAPYSQPAAEPKYYRCKTHNEYWLAEGNPTRCKRVHEMGVEFVGDTPVATARDCNVVETKGPSPHRDKQWRCTVHRYEFESPSDPPKVCLHFTGAESCNVVENETHWYCCPTHETTFETLQQHASHCPAYDGIVCQVHGQFADDDDATRFLLMMRPETKPDIDWWFCSQHDDIFKAPVGELCGSADQPRNHNTQCNVHGPFPTLEDANNYWARETPQESGKTFGSELETLVNKYSKENGSNTPDFILSSFLLECLVSWDAATNARDKWYSIAPEPCWDGKRLSDPEDDEWDSPISKTHPDDDDDNDEEWPSEADYPQPGYAIPGAPRKVPSPDATPMDLRPEDRRRLAPESLPAADVKRERDIAADVKHATQVLRDAGLEPEVVPPGESVNDNPFAIPPGKVGTSTGLISDHVDATEYAVRQATQAGKTMGQLLADEVNAKKQAEFAMQADWLSDADPLQDIKDAHELVMGTAGMDDGFNHTLINLEQSARRNGLHDAADKIAIARANIGRARAEIGRKMNVGSDPYSKPDGPEANDG